MQPHTTPAQALPSSRNWLLIATSPRSRVPHARDVACAAPADSTAGSPASIGSVEAERASRSAPARNEGLEHRWQVKIFRSHNLLGGTATVASHDTFESTSPLLRAHAMPPLVMSGGMPFEPSPGVNR